MLSGLLFRGWTPATFPFLPSHISVYGFHACLYLPSLFTPGGGQSGVFTSLCLAADPLRTQTSTCMPSMMSIFVFLPMFTMSSLPVTCVLQQDPPLDLMLYVGWQVNVATHPCLHLPSLFTPGGGHATVSSLLSCVWLQALHVHTPARAGIP